MNKINRNTLILIIGTLICILPMFVFIANYNQIPAEIPTQFGLNGKVNNTSPKEVFIFAMPAFAIFINLSVYFRRKKEENKFILANILIPIIFMMIQFVTFFMVI